jgi:hypothetical protein
MTVLTETTARQWCRIPKVGFGYVAAGAGDPT